MDLTKVRPSTFPLYHPKYTYRVSPKLLSKLKHVIAENKSYNVCSYANCLGGFVFEIFVFEIIAFLIALFKLEKLLV